MKLTNNEKKNLKEWIRKFFSEAGQDYQSFDSEAEIDSSLSFEENKSILREKIKVFLNEYQNVEKLKKKDAEIITKEEYTAKLDSEIKRVERQAELEFNKVLEKIENDKTTNFIEDIYFMPKQYAKMVSEGYAKGFILYGEAGLGKSYSVMRSFREAGKDFVYHTGHITSLQLYQFLYTNRKENIVFDDVNILDNEVNLNMLKACLNDNSRIVGYDTSSNKLKVPNKFMFEGTITILINTKKGNENLRAVESRVLNYELKFDYETKIKVIFELARQDYKELTFEERQTIASWIKDNTNEATTNLNLRLLFHLYEIYRFDRQNWIKMAIEMIDTNEEVSLILKGMTEREWIEVTGKSRRTYYNYKEKLKH